MSPAAPVKRYRSCSPDTVSSPTSGSPSASIDDVVGRDGHDLDVVRPVPPFQLRTCSVYVPDIGATTRSWSSHTYGAPLNAEPDGASSSW